MARPNPNYTASPSTSTAPSPNPNYTTHSSTSTAPSPNPNCNCHFDVFINYCPSDVQNNFASHLYHRLLDRGFRTFFERPEIQLGDRLDSRVEGAIATASVHIPIFSPRYAKSKWCLDELLLILKSKTAIIPVFYNVKLSDLRIRMGEGKEQVPGQISGLLGDHVGNNGVYDKALFDVSHLSGLELEACKSDEGELVHRVVQRAEEEVAKPHFRVGKYVAGFDKKLEDLEKAVLLQRQQHKRKAKFVWIVGVGGVGKTTLATEFFNRKMSAYHGSCFLSDVREAAGLTTLDHEIVSVAEGKVKLSISLSNLWAVIVLDDVDDVQQMDALYSPLKDVLDSGSLILVTSRNKDVLKMSGMRESDIYNLTGLDREHSQELFCLHAFHKRLPAFRFKEVVPTFLDVCGGLPLCLKVLGALVYQKDLKYWKTSLRKISLVLPANVQSILKISYDSLDDQEKDIFLDIACFLNGEDRDTVISIWDASGWVGWLNLQNLVNKCLVDIGNKSRIRMHHHLIDLGRDLAGKNPSRFRRRLWRPNENHFDNAWKNSTVRGIHMIEVRSGKSVKDAVEVDMSTLQLLKAEGDCLESISNLLEHSDLLWLSWNHCPDHSLPSWIPRRNLRFLRVAGSKLETLWLHESEAPLNLRELIIDAPNFQIPKSIGQLKYLEKIELRYTMETLPDEFFHVTSLKNLRMYTSGKSLTLPESFGNLTNLRELDFTGCSALKWLPESFGNLMNLRDLRLSGCSELQGLPNSLGSLTTLQQFDLSGCSLLQELPNSLGGLTALQQFNLSRCKELQTLPASLGNLTGLQWLIMSDCFQLETLPDLLGNLTGLQELNLFRCSSLQILPDSLGNLTGLQELNLFGCSSLQILPNSLRYLTALQRLNLSGCSFLKRLPDSLRYLTALQRLNLSKCSLLKRLPALRYLTALQRLNLSRCSSLQRLPALRYLVALQRLNLSGCSSLQRLPALRDLVALQRLNLSGCSCLLALPHSLGKLIKLQELDLSCCSSLQTLPDSLGNLTGLQRLNLSECSQLRALPDSLGNLKGLQQLNLCECSQLQSLPESVGNLKGLQQLDLSGWSQLLSLTDSVMNLTDLQHLKLSRCSQLERLPDSLGNLTGLQQLDLSSCSQLKRVPDSLGNLTGLQHLKLSRCSQLERLPDSLGNLTGLQQLNLFSCWMLERLPDSLGNLTGLQQLNLSSCSQLKRLPDSLGNLTGLHQLNLSSCIQLERLPDSLGNLTGLQQLNLSACSRLERLPDSLGNLTGLQELNLSSCSRLERLPDSLGNLTGLQQLDLSSCPRLQILPGSMRHLTCLPARDGI